MYIHTEIYRRCDKVKAKRAIKILTNELLFYVVHSHCNLFHSLMLIYFFYFCEEKDEN